MTAATGGRNATGERHNALLNDGADGHILLIDPDPSSRSLIRRAVEDYSPSMPVTSAATSASVPVDGLDTPLTLVISSEVGHHEVAPLVEMLMRPDTHIVMILRMRARDGFEDLANFPVDAVVHSEDLHGPALGEALTHRARNTVVVSREAVRQLFHLAGKSGACTASTPSLTEREAETLQFMAAGMSNRQIARDMGITEHGVKRHISHIFAKLNCRNRTTAVAMALRTGLVQQENSA
ncbi:helix-turn-helix transcriptional regulator [Streptomyces sp. YU58]|uniref:helix-turn-helix transcriptional regulator n=1 Tax=Streptomyces sp. SX92 TaxID=3158972 RepID=UPI0027BAC84D|nr:response regulator transcription factor [Streptomyces coralus]WLW50165.1 response regulator transcription factor [Streptomyces coralus]